MRRVSNIAISECVAELRAASRRPIDESAIDTLVAWLRPNFERLLDRANGGRRWADQGQTVRNNSRYLGALADFFGERASTEIVGIKELLQAFTVIRAGCTTRARRAPLAHHYCDLPNMQVDVREAEDFFRAIAR